MMALSVSRSVHPSVNNHHDIFMMFYGNVSRQSVPHKNDCSPFLVSELCPFENRKKNLVCPITH